MNRNTPVIVEAAINGAVSKEENPHVPRTVAEISASALACLDAGASIVHNHNDEPNVGGSGRHASEPYVAAWRSILERYPDAILYPTYAGGGPHTSVQERYAHIDELREAGVLGMPLLDPGTTNFGGLDADGAPGESDLVYQTTFADVRWMVDYCRRHRLSPSISIFEPGWLRLALAYHERGELPRGSLIKLYFGTGRMLFGLSPTGASSKHTSRCSKAPACPGSSPSSEGTPRTGWRRWPSSAAGTSVSASKTTTGHGCLETKTSSGKSSPWPRRPGVP